MRRAPQKRPTKPFSSTGVAQPSARFTSAPATPERSSFTNLTPPTVILSALCTRFILPSSAPLSAPGESAATNAGSGATAAPFAPPLDDFPFAGVPLRDDDCISLIVRWRQSDRRLFASTTACSSGCHTRQTIAARPQLWWHGRRSGVSARRAAGRWAAGAERRATRAGTHSAEASHAASRFDPNFESVPPTLGPAARASPWITPMRPKAPVRFFFGAASAKYALKSAIWKKEDGGGGRRIARQNCAAELRAARLEAEAGDEACHRHLRERRRGGEERVARRRDEERERDHRAPADVVGERAEQRREHRLGRPERRLQQPVRGGRRAGVGDQEGQHRHEHRVRRLREQYDRVRPAEERERRALARVPRLHRAERDVDRDGHPYLLRRRVGLVVVVHDYAQLLATRSATAGCSERW